MITERSLIDRHVPQRGFCDLKEQWLRRVTESGVRVHVADAPGRGSMRVASRETAIAAMRFAHGAAAAGSFADHGFDGIREVATGANVGVGSCLADSIVMPGGPVGRGALVVRSLVMPGGVVGEGDVVIDRVVTAGPHPRSLRRA